MADELSMTTFDAQRERSTELYAEPDTRKRITTFDQQTAHLVQEWVDPVQRLKDEAETRKRLELAQLRETVSRIQQRIAELEKELS